MNIPLFDVEPRVLSALPTVHFYSVSQIEVLEKGPKASLACANVLSFCKKESPNQGIVFQFLSWNKSLSGNRCLLLKAGRVNLGLKGLEWKPPTAANCFFLQVSFKLLSRPENVG